MEAVKKFLRFESPNFPVLRKCCFCVSILRGVIVYGYVNLVLLLISLPVLIFALIEMRTDGKVTSVPLEMPEPEIQLPLHITLVAVDVVLTVILLIGVHQKRSELLKICFYAGVPYNFLTTCSIFYFNSGIYIQHVIDIPFMFFSWYLLFVIYNAVYVLEQNAARAADVQYVTYRDRHGL